MFTIYTQSESLLWGKSDGYIFIQNGPLLQELWAGWVRMTLRKFKLHCYPFRNASFAPVLRSVSVQRSTRPLFTCVLFLLPRRFGDNRTTSSRLDWFDFSLHVYILEKCRETRHSVFDLRRRPHLRDLEIQQETLMTVAPVETYSEHVGLMFADLRLIDRWICHNRANRIVILATWHMLIQN